MGIVWRALDLDLEEQVAIKFLREEFARDETLRGWFRREVKLARRVTHPNVARVFELGRDGHEYFLTMEFVPGESLLALLERERRLAPARVRGLATELCHGLAAAHAAGVIHGDIKPGNILLTPSRGAVLTDFGVARVLSDAHLTPASGSGGTPLYMAPEQLGEDVYSLQGDVYAVGVVLCEALTGQFPWPVDTLTALVDAKCNGHDPDLTALMPHLPPAWRETVRACLHSDRRQRPPDAGALLAMIADLPRAAPEPGGPEPTPRTPPASPTAATDHHDRWTEALAKRTPRGGL